MKKKTPKMYKVELMLNGEVCDWLRSLAIKAGTTTAQALSILVALTVDKNMPKKGKQK